MPPLAAATWRTYFPLMAKRKKKDADADEEPEVEAEEAEEEQLDPIELALRGLRRSQRRFGVLVLVLVLIAALGGSAGEIYMLRADMDAMNQRVEKSVAEMNDNLARIQDQTAARRVGIDVVRKDQAHMKAQMRHMSRFLKAKAKAAVKKDTETSG